MSWGLSDWRDPARINDLWQVMYRAGFYRGGPILMSAIAGIDRRCGTSKEGVECAGLAAAGWHGAR